MLSLQEDFKIQLDKLTTAPFFVARLCEYGLEGFKYEILSDKHREDVKEIMASQLSREGGNITRTIYNITERENEETNAYHRFDHLINHAIKTGLSFVVIDTKMDNKVAAFNIFWDVCDRAPRADWSKYPIKYTKKGEFTKIGDKGHSFWDQLKENIKYGLIKKGECIEFDLGVINRKYGKIKPSQYIMLVAICYALTFSIKKLKYFITKLSHPASIKSMLRMTEYFNKMDQNHIAFYSYLSDTKTFFVEKFKNDEWYKNNVDQEFVMNNINKLRIGSQAVCLEKLREKYNIEQFFEHYIRAMTTKVIPSKL